MAVEEGTRKSFFPRTRYYAKNKSVTNPKGQASIQSEVVSRNCTIWRTAVAITIERAADPKEATLSPFAIKIIGAITTAQMIEAISALRSA